MARPKIHPDTLRKMRTGETNGIGGGQFVPHFLLLRDSRILPLADELWKKSGKDPDRFVEEVFEYITRNVGYAFDEDIEGGLTEYVQMPHEVLNRGWGDCLPGMVEIVFKNGSEIVLRKIGDVVENQMPGEVLTYSQDGGLEFNKIISYQKKGIKEVCRIGLRGGRSLYATSGHRFFTMAGNGELSDVAVADMSPGHYVMGLSDYPLMNISYDKEDLLWVDGLYVADGWNDGHHVCIGKKDVSYLQRVAAILNRYDLPYTIFDRDQGRGGTPYISIHKSWYKDRLSKMGRCAPEKRFLEEHLSLPEKQMRLLLDGYSEDACRNPTRGNLKIIYATTSNVLARQLIFIHNMLGEPLVAQWREDSGGAGKNPLPIWRLSYTPTSEFVVNVPLKYDWVVSRLKETYPRLGSGVGSKIKGEKPPQISKQFPSIRKSKIVQWAERSDLKEMLWACKSSIMWFRIKEIENVGVMETYDIGVNNNHNFVLGNGILSHNCDCSAIAMISMLVAKGIPCHVTFGYAGAGSHRWPEVKYKNGWYVFDTTNGEVFPIEQRLDRGYLDMFYVTPHSFRPSWSPIPLYLP